MLLLTQVPFHGSIVTPQEQTPPLRRRATPPSAMTRLHGNKSGGSTSSLRGHHCQFRCAGLGQCPWDPRGLSTTSPMMARAVLTRAYARVHLASPRSHLDVSPSHRYTSLVIPAENWHLTLHPVIPRTGVFTEKSEPLFFEPTWVYLKILAVFREMINRIVLLSSCMFSRV